MKVKSAIFDFDGTLFDSMYVWNIAGERYMRSIGKEPEPTIYEDVKTMSLHQAAAYMKEEYQIDLTVEEIIEGMRQTASYFYLHEIQPKEGVIDFLKALKNDGVSMCVATASDRYLVESALERCRMDGFFEEIFTCGEVGHGKDEPFIYRSAMEYCDAKRNNTVVFEDAMHAAQTAKKDGFRVVAVYDESEEQQEEMHRLCDCYLPDFKHTEPFWKLTVAEEAQI